MSNNFCTKRNGVPVVIFETGEEFNSIQACADYINADPKWVGKVARGEPGYNTCHGYHIVAIDRLPEFQASIDILGRPGTSVKILESGEEFTAVYSISDSMAIGACKAILDSGKRIPQDYSVVGFDGLDITYYYNPSITTIRQPVEAMARETTKILFDLINNKATNQHKVFEAELVERESTLKLSK